MAKKHKKKSNQPHVVQNRILALMSDPMFRQRKVKMKKGKGSYTRKNSRLVYDLMRLLNKRIRL